MRHLSTLEHLAASQPEYFASQIITVLDLYVAVCLRWMALYPVATVGWLTLERLPQLHALTLRIEQRASSRAAIIAEGLGTTPFSAPSYPNPPEGSAI